MTSITLNQEMAWITFSLDGFEKKWFPVMLNGKHLKWDSQLVMNVCRNAFPDNSWGISPTSQMIMGHSCRDNF